MNTLRLVLGSVMLAMLLGGCSAAPTSLLARPATLGKMPPGAQCPGSLIKYCTSYVSERSETCRCVNRARLRQSMDGMFGVYRR